jgi:Rap1a immunity proteins
MRSILLGTFFAVFVVNSAFGTSADLVIPFCNTKNFGNLFYSGLCSGIVEAITDNGSQLGVCIPAGVTYGEENLVVYKYANDHPEMLHLEMASIVLFALTRAWPCSSAGHPDHRGKLRGPYHAF